MYSDENWPCLNGYSDRMRSMSARSGRFGFGASRKKDDRSCAISAKP